MTILVSIYSHHEYYPPTIHAVLNLATVCNKVVLLTRNQGDNNFIFPSNVEIVLSGERVGLDESFSKPFFWKLGSFVRFVKDTRRLIKKHKPDWVLNYDNVPLLATEVARWGIRFKFKWWYHNHDVAEISTQKKFSIGWWACKKEHALFKKLDMFSLPAEERLKYFPQLPPGCRYFFTPNYPSQLFYKAITTNGARKPAAEIKLIYQGSLSKGHGFEQIIPLLNNDITGRALKLTLIGRIAPSYKEELEAIAIQHGTFERLSIEPPVNYMALASVTREHHIGIAIHTPFNLIYQTGGTASNKIYEYVAAGLPVLLFDSEHYRHHLSKYTWAFFTDCSTHSLTAQLQNIVADLDNYSKSATRDFQQKLNFENGFASVINYLKEHK
jgi:hypothetical protein